MAIASSGLAAAVLAPGAVAAPESVAMQQVDVTALTALARSAAAVSPSVLVPTDGEWSIPTTEVAGKLPPPPPPPVRTRTTTTTSRTVARAATTTPTYVEAPASATAAAVLEIARRYVGVPYVYGGSSPAGFDCSGFTQYVFRQVGISLPRTSSAQRYAGRVVSASEARAGDLIWWPGHVGIYTGNGQHIAARRPGTPLHEGPIWGSNPVFVRVL